MDCFAEPVIRRRLRADRVTSNDGVGARHIPTNRQRSHSARGLTWKMCRNAPGRRMSEKFQNFSTAVSGRFRREMRGKGELKWGSRTQWGAAMPDRRADLCRLGGSNMFGTRYHYVGHARRRRQAVARRALGLDGAGPGNWTLRPRGRHRRRTRLGRPIRGRATSSTRTTGPRAACRPARPPSAPRTQQR